MHELSLWHFIADAGPVVKLVMLMLLLASIASWTIIIQRGGLFRFAKQQAVGFEASFWSGADLTTLYEGLEKSGELTGLERIFQAGFAEFQRLTEKPTMQADAVMEGVSRTMRVALAHETERLEKHLGFLATVGSTSPYVGLFGTVWGIMTSFRALGAVQQATIAMVAPGISEALIATAMGLFAAIPAVIFYNRYSNQLDRLLNQYETFQEEFTSILHRQVHAS